MHDAIALGAFLPGIELADPCRLQQTEEKG
jgi:hypothetical protein